MNESDKRTFRNVYCRAENKLVDAIRFARRGRESKALEALAEGLLLFNTTLQLISKYHGEANYIGPIAADSFIRASDLAHRGRENRALQHLAEGLKMSLIMVIHIGDP